MKTRTSLLIVLILLTFTGLLSCQNGPDSFGLYLADTGEILFSGEDVAVYHSGYGTLELKDAGMQKWNSYFNYESVPQSSRGLFNKEFILKIDGDEVCRGKIWSNLSSQSYSGVAILDGMIKLNNAYNSVWIRSSYPGNDPPGDKISSEISRYFERHGKLAD